MIAIIGGTGRLGLGLARRLSRTRTPLLIGSRDENRARAAAAEAGLGAQHGRTNMDAARNADLVIIAVPIEGHEPTLRALAPHLGGKVLLDTTVHYSRVTRSVVLPDGISAAERAQRLVPTARVVSGFHTVSGAMLADLERPAQGDVLFCGDDAGAKDPVAAMVRSIGMRAVDAGALATSRLLEQLAGLLIDLNRRYKKKDLTIQIAGLE
ncbi:MAG TPA: NADPH-dependent F420 reductase [bacterium]|nr:NADPH-dependent F420 reductase [bacterium]